MQGALFGAPFLFGASEVKRLRILFEWALDVDQQHGLAPSRQQWDARACCRTVPLLAPWVSSLKKVAASNRESDGRSLVGTTFLTTGDLYGVVLSMMKFASYRLASLIFRRLLLPQ